MDKTNLKLPILSNHEQYTTNTGKLGHVVEIDVSR